MKKIAGILASIFMALALVGGSAFLLHEVEKTSVVEEDIATKATSPSSNEGWSLHTSGASWISSDGFVEINSPEDLAHFAKVVNDGGTWQGGGLVADSNFRLAADIDISSYWWDAPIGTANHPFNGTFDGNGKTISGMFIKFTGTKSDKELNLGLFGCLKGEVKNLTIDGSVYLYSGSISKVYNRTYNVGGIAGKTTAQITNCTSNVSINYIRSANNVHDLKGTLNVGGIVGYTTNKVDSCSSTANIMFNQSGTPNTTGKKIYYYYHFGGIAGSGSGVFQSCAYFGTMKFRYIYNIDHLYVGGIVAKCSNDIMDCISQGGIFLDGEIVHNWEDWSTIGGIVGYTFSSIAISRSHNYTSIVQNISVGNPSFQIGGIIGRAEGKLNITDCSNFGYIKNNFVVAKNTVGTGGIIGSANGGCTIDCCINYGNIAGTINGHTGGIIGHIDTSETKNTNAIYWCLNYGSVYCSAQTNTTGGIAGYYNSYAVQIGGTIFVYGTIANSVNFASGSVFGTAVNTLAYTCYTKTSFEQLSGAFNNTISAIFQYSANWTKIESSCENSKTLASYGPDDYAVNNISKKFYGPSLLANNYLQSYIKTLESSNDEYKWIYDDIKNTPALEIGAILPLSLISTTKIDFYVGESKSNRVTYTNWSSSVGTIQSDSGAVRETYKTDNTLKVMTLKRQGVSNSSIFSVNTTNYSMYIDSQTIYAGDSASLSIDNSKLKFSVGSNTNRPADFEVRLQPKLTTVSIIESGASGGTVSVNNIQLTQTSFETYNYIYSGSCSINISVISPSGYGISSISFGGTICANANPSASSFAASHSFSKSRDFNSVTITYIPLSKDINFSYRLGINGTKQRGTSCTYGGIDMTKTTVAVSPNSITFSHDKWIYLYTNPGYHISSISIVNNTETTYFNNLSDTWLNNYLNTNYRYINVSSITINYARTTFNTNIYVDGTLKKENLSLDLSASKSMQTLTNDDGIESGYKYGVYAGGVAISSVAGCFELGTSTEVSPHRSSLKLAKNNNEHLYAQVTIALSDFVGQRVYTSRKTGADAYSSNSQNLYIDLRKEEVNIKIADKNKVYNGTSYTDAPNTNTKDSLNTDTYGNPIGGMTYLTDLTNVKYYSPSIISELYSDENLTNEISDKFIPANDIFELIEENTSQYKKINYNNDVYYIKPNVKIERERKIDEYIQTNQDATFSAIAMPGYVFKGVVAVKGSQSPDDNPVQIDALSNAFDMFLKISNLSVGDDIDYSQLENTTIYAYYDIATYKIETYKQIDKNGKENVTYDSTNGYFDWTEGPSSDDRKILSYFDEITFAVKSERYSSDNLEFLGIYLLDGSDEKLLTLDTQYTFVNYNPNFVFTNKVYSDLIDNEEVKTTGESPVEITNYARFDVFDVHEKYIDLKYKGTGYYIEQNPSSYLRLLVKFATKPTTSSAPTQSNNVIEISSVADLVWLSYNINSGEFDSKEGAYNQYKNGNYIIKQTANIDFGDSYIDPIGTEDRPFKGTYDGQGYVIKNLKLTNGNTAIGTNVGLFGYTDGATIKNLTLIGGSVTGFDNVGAVVGCAENTTFENVTNNGCHVTAITYAYYDIYGKKITYFMPFAQDIDVDKYDFKRIMRQNLSRITYKSDRAYGGLVGVVSNCTIEGCGVRANITDTKQVDVDVTIVRGLIGTAFYTNDDTTEIPIKECYYIGNLPLQGEESEDILDSLVYYIPEYEDPEEQIEIIENCFYDTNSTRYYIINSDENGTEDQIEPNKFDSAIWFKIGNSYELKIFYWS